MPGVPARERPVRKRKRWHADRRRRRIDRPAVFLASSFSIDLRRLHFGFTLLAHDSETLCLSVLRTKKGRLEIGFEEQLDDLLSARAKVDFAPMAVVLSFVRFGNVNPDPSARVQIACTHSAYFTGTSAGQELQVDDRFDRSGNKRADRIDEGFRDGSDRLGFSCLGATTLQPADGEQSMIDRWRYQLIFRRPSKQPLDSFHPVIDDAPAKRLLRTI